MTDIAGAANRWLSWARKPATEPPSDAAETALDASALPVPLPGAGPAKLDVEKTLEGVG
jgi:hypothetical protein